MDKQELDRVIRAVEEMTRQGLSHLNAWRQIGEVLAVEPELLDLAPMFFLRAAGAHLSLATLEAAKLTEERRDSISPHRMLRVAEQHCTGFSASEGADLRIAVSAGSVALHRLGDLRQRVKTYRDKVLAHHDPVNLKVEFANEQRLQADQLHQNL